MRIINRCKTPAKITAFTGHRKLPWLRDEWHPLDTKRRLSEAIETMYGEGKNTFICGLALGADTLFAEEVIR